MSGLERPMAEDIAEACKAKLCDHLDDLSTSLGSIEALEHQRLEGAEGVKERLIIEVGEKTGIVTIQVGGTDGVAAEEIIKGLFDSLRSTCMAKEDNSIILVEVVYMLHHSKLGRLQRLPLDVKGLLWKLSPEPWSYSQQPLHLMQVKTKSMHY